jgi:uncharacterized protein YegP (UPF0339 family)
MPKKYQLYKDVNGKFRFRLRAENNKIVAVSQVYEQHASCLNGIKSIQMNCKADIEDLTVEGPRIVNPKYQIFYDKSCGYRFHLNAKNGEIIAASEGYETKEGCLNGVNAVKTSCDAEIEDLTLTQKPKEETVCYDEIPASTAVEKAAEMQPVISETAVETKEVPQEVVVPPVEVQPPIPAGPVQTMLELQNPSSAKKGDIVYFQGTLKSDSGKGVPNVKIDVYERDRSLLGDDYLAYGNTADDGSFNISWKARPLAWFDNTGEIYARFKGNEQAKPSKSAIQKITIN